MKSGRLEGGWHPDGNGFKFDIVVRHIHQTVERIVSSPRVFANKKLISFTIVSQSYNSHTVVVGSTEGFKGLLTQSLRNCMRLVFKSGHTLLKTRLANIAFPTNGMTCTHGTLDNRHHTVEREVEKGVLIDVIGHL